VGGLILLGRVNEDNDFKKKFQTSMNLGKWVDWLFLVWWI